MSDTISLDALDESFGELDPNELDPSSMGNGTTDSAPKRRGRPPGSSNKSSAGLPNQKPPTQRRRGTNAGSKTFVHGQIVALVGLGNVALGFLSKPDMLNEPEMTLLSDALTAEAMSSERAMRWIMGAAGVTPHVLMIQCVITLMVPRLQRRGILPKAPDLTDEQYNTLTPEQQVQYDEYIRQRNSAAQAETESARTSASTEPSVQMETRGASQFDGGYR